MENEKAEELYRLASKSAEGAQGAEGKASFRQENTYLISQVRLSTAGCCNDTPYSPVRWAQAIGHTPLSAYPFLIHQRSAISDQQ